jgi:hypothetical protein
MNITEWWWCSFGCSPISHPSVASKISKPQIPGQLTCHTKWNAEDFELIARNELCIVYYLFRFVTLNQHTLQFLTSYERSTVWLNYSNGIKDVDLN